jgi:hypothetical protein
VAALFILGTFSGTGRSGIRVPWAWTQSVEISNFGAVHSGAFQSIYYRLAASLSVGSSLSMVSLSMWALVGPGSLIVAAGFIAVTA